MTTSKRQWLRVLVVLVLLTATVPWGAGRLMSGMIGLLPGWVWYALILNVVFATGTCLLYEKWWKDESVEKDCVDVDDSLRREPDQ